MSAGRAEGDLIRRVINLERRAERADTIEPETNTHTVDGLHAKPSTPHAGEAITDAHVTATDSTGALALQATSANIASVLTLQGGTAKQYTTSVHDRLLMQRLVSGTTLADVAALAWGRNSNRRFLNIWVVDTADTLQERALFGEDGGILLGNMAVTRVGTPGDAVHIGGTGQPITATRQQLNILEYTTSPGVGTGGGICFKGSFSAGSPGTLVEYAAIVGKRETAGSGVYGYLGFGTRGTEVANQVTERARITYQGHLLINTTTDDVYHLDVAGAARFTGGITAASLTLAAQVANRVFAGPASGADAAPTFRALVDADMPGGAGAYFLLAGRAGGQIAYGGTASGDDLTLESTSHATKGYVLIAPGGSYVGIGMTVPEAPLHVAWSTADGEMRNRIGFGGVLQRNAGDHVTNPTPYFMAQRGRGTQASPTTVQSGDGLFAFMIGGYDGAAWKSGWNGGAQMMAYATENWTTTAHGAEWWFYTTPNTSASPSLRLKIKHGGALELRPASTPSGVTDATHIYSTDQGGEAGNSGLHVRGETGDITSIGNRISTTGGLVINSGGGSASTYDATIKSDNYDALFIDASNDSIALMNHASGKVGFFGATPVVKQTGCAVPTDLATCIAAITALRTALNNMGLTTVV